MACPVLCSLGGFALIAGVGMVFTDDPHRVLWRRLGLALIVLWTGYFTLLRERPALVTLEVVSSLYVLLILVRAFWLLYYFKMKPRWYSCFERGMLAMSSFVLQPVTVMCKSFILFMVFLEWIDRAHFRAIEYLYASALLVTWLLILFGWRRLLQPFILRQRNDRNDVMPQLALDEDSRGTACPLGFGGASRSL